MGTHARTFKQQAKAFLSCLSLPQEGCRWGQEDCLFCWEEKAQQGGEAGWIEARALQELETPPLPTPPK